MYNAVIKVFNSLTCRLTNLKNAKAQLKAALRRYLDTDLYILLINFSCLKMTPKLIINCI